MPKANALAYFASPSATTKDRFITSSSDPAEFFRRAERGRVAVLVADLLHLTGALDDGQVEILSNFSFTAEAQDKRVLELVPGKLLKPNLIFSG